MPLSLYKIRTSVAFLEKVWVGENVRTHGVDLAILPYWGAFTIGHASWDEAAAVVPRRGSVAAPHHLSTEVANRAILVGVRPYRRNAS